MKNKDKNISLSPMKAKELLQLKGGYWKSPRGTLANMAQFSGWEDFEIRFQDNGGLGRKLVSPITSLASNGIIK